MTLDEKLVQQIQTILNQQYNLNIEDGMVMIEIPKDSNNGDYSSNVAMRLAKNLKRKPQQIAEELKDILLEKLDYVENIEVAGPGFINFWLIFFISKPIINPT